MLGLFVSLAVRLVGEAAGETSVLGETEERSNEGDNYTGVGSLTLSQMWVWLNSELQSHTLTSSFDEIKVASTPKSPLSLWKQSDYQTNCNVPPSHPQDITSQHF